MGNIIPAAIWLIPTGLGIRQILITHDLTGRGLWLLLLADALGWAAMNQVGLYQNARMRRRLLAMLGKSGKLADDRFFVGFSSPKYTGVLDAHEDVGFLCFTDDDVSFVSETRSLHLTRHEIESVRYRANVHTIVGLGRWISIEGSRNQAPIRMLVEPREKRTMLGNLLIGKKVKAHINEWLTQPTKV